MRQNIINKKWKKTVVYHALKKKVLITEVKEEIMNACELVEMKWRSSEMINAM